MRELETDVVELLIRLAESVVQNDVYCQAGMTEKAKDQVRDALNKLIDERVHAAIATAFAPPAIDTRLVSAEDMDPHFGVAIDPFSGVVGGGPPLRSTQT